MMRRSRGYLSGRHLPGAAAIGGAVNSVPPTGGIAIVRFAGAHPNDVGIRGRDRDRADRERVDSLSKIGSKVTPLLLVLKTPPVARPT